MCGVYVSVYVCVKYQDKQKQNKKKNKNGEEKKEMGKLKNKKTRMFVMRWINPYPSPLYGKHWATSQTQPLVPVDSICFYFSLYLPRSGEVKNGKVKYD